MNLFKTVFALALVSAASARGLQPSGYALEVKHVYTPVKQYSGSEEYTKGLDGEGSFDSGFIQSYEHGLSSFGEALDGGYESHGALESYKFGGAQDGEYENHESGGLVESYGYDGASESHGFGGTSDSYGYGGGEASHDDGHDHIGHYSHPAYKYEYGVKDPKTGDHKSAWEHRDGDKVVGEYSLDEADGTKRVVSYTADHKNGFQAIVKKIGHALHLTH
ncbi:unnamed protein product [Diamesa serratosioi]